MNTPIEDRVRDLLADRTAEVSPPVDWEERVVSAGRRRRVRRRVGVIGGAVVAVVLVMFAAAVNLPESIRGVEPVSPTGSTHAPIDPGDLPEGAETPHLYATGQSNGPATVISDGLSWAAQSRVGTLLSADGGFVAMLSWDTDRLAFRGANGVLKTLQSSEPVSGVAVSSDGRRVAWMNSEDSDTRFGTLELAELPSGRVTASMPVTKADLPGRGTPTVVGFLGGNVVLGSEGAQWPSVWDPGAERIEPLPGATKVAGRLVALHEDSGTLLLMTADGCIRPLPNDTSSTRWPASVCGLDPASEVRISPDGRWFAGFQPDGDTVWVRDLRTGRLVWQQRFRKGLDLDGSISERTLVSGLRLSQLAWESPDALLVTYGSPRDLDSEVADMMRCAADRPACERVPTKAGERVTSLGQ